MAAGFSEPAAGWLWWRCVKLLPEKEPGGGSLAPFTGTWFRYWACWDWTPLVPEGRNCWAMSATGRPIDILGLGPDILVMKGGLIDWLLYSPARSWAGLMCILYNLT